MGFWIFMLINSLLMPILMIVFGKIFQSRPPGRINSMYGYRTKMSMLNMDTWNYAHRFFGKLWHRIGWWMLPLTILGMLYALGKGESIVGIVGGVVITIQVIVLFIPIAQTERELRRIFGADGRRKY